MNPVEEKIYYIAYFDILGYRDFFAKATNEEIQGIVACIYDGILGIKGYLFLMNRSNMRPIIENFDVKYLGFSDNFTFVLEVGDGQSEIYRLLGFLEASSVCVRNI